VGVSKSDNYNYAKYKERCVLGTPYEMGYAQGELMKDVASTFIDDVWTYLEEEAVGSCKRLEKRNICKFIISSHLTN
jgi:hypothetical protein